MRSSAPCSSKRQSSTRSAFSEKIAKFVPSPSPSGPSGNGSPAQPALAKLHRPRVEIGDQCPVATPERQHTPAGGHVELARKPASKRDELSVQSIRRVMPDARPLERPGVLRVGD